MKDSAAFAQLLRIRNMRADNFGRELAQLQRHLAELDERRRDVEVQLRESETRASAVLANLLRPGRRVEGWELERAAEDELALRKTSAALARRRDELERERAAVEKEIARCERDLQRARKTALRTELMEETAREPPH
ncbi:hypothetical protein SJ05684_b47790 (plasmid) [Sinorhizobium sojae CCBAU 05684]|uniref:Uncharacterized protein n=1 Tax=Sinorhizobium sojae CCBAU 05684 TaxID=716928 RepID=A0A249PIN2_9HYPH|nr:hypothetical protein [Sinorhizobium sojae]ASY65761.1 hypothetical protein SJ05684_b47790 [Sinorhizobium sojae CCBAU 05684]